MERIEVITGVQRRRRYSAQEKAFMVAECERPGMSVSLVARRHGISASLLFRWSHCMVTAKVSTAFDSTGSSGFASAGPRLVRKMSKLLITIR